MDLVFGMLLAGERGDANAACVSGVKAFDEGACLLCNSFAGLPALEKIGKTHVSFAADAVIQVLKEVEGAVLGAPGECVVGEAGVDAINGFEGGICVTQQTK